VPAALLGAGTDVVVLLHDHLAAELAVGVLLAVAFELYVGWAELIVAADRGEGAMPSHGTRLRRAAALTPTLVAASFVGVTLPLAAAGLLLIPGLWLLTRWSLFAPAIVHEHLGARASLSRSSALVRGAFWAVAFSVTASVLVEHAVIHATAHTAEPALGSLALGLAGAALATTLVSPPAAFTISIVYERLVAQPGRRRTDSRRSREAGSSRQVPRTFAFCAANSASVRIPCSCRAASSLSCAIGSAAAWGAGAGGGGGGGGGSGACSYSWAPQRLAWRRDTRLLTAVAVPAMAAVRATPRISPGMMAP
jgi:hypothetical protein